MVKKDRTVFVLLLVLLLLAGLSGCAVTETTVMERPVWPKPPEIARYEYNSTLRTDLSFTGKKSSFAERIGGVGAQESPIFAKPYDVAARGGVLLVSDTVLRTVHMLILPTRSIFRIGASGGDGALTKPVGVAIDGNGRIYVADVTARVVKVYESNGHYRMTVGGPELMVKPTDVAVNDEGTRIYVVDTGGIESKNHQVQVFDGEGLFIKTIGTRGSGEGEFNLPVQAAVNALGELYVLDAGNFRVQVFSADGDFIRAWGKVGRNMGDFARPRGLALDSDGLVYVTDAAFGNFQVFRDDGQLMLFVGENGSDLPGEYALLAGIAVDELGWVYLLDQKYNKLDVIKKIQSDLSNNVQ
ncbi:hypothetical protein MNBD_GAMMA18-247 [hydrothermal vent metagenome]|uniref:NHL repeat domain protein n=1 Tax=hydrothermal vent metagenome TaxID=652676 RepID=A0A3B0Z4X6_9ZZZZ